jgi:hypothetical protein
VILSHVRKGLIEHLPHVAESPSIVVFVAVIVALPLDCIRSPVLFPLEAFEDEDIGLPTIRPSFTLAGTGGGGIAYNKGSSRPASCFQAATRSRSEPRLAAFEVREGGRRPGRRPSLPLAVTGKFIGRFADGLVAKPGRWSLSGRHIKWNHVEARLS